MSRELRSNTTVPDIFPIPETRRTRQTERTVTMIDAAGAAGAAAEATTSTPVIWLKNPLQGNFNPGTVSGQKIFLEKTKCLDADKRLNLTNTDATAIVDVFKVKEQLMGDCITAIPTEYPGGAGTKMMNMIH